MKVVSFNSVIAFLIFLPLVFSGCSSKTRAASQPAAAEQFLPQPTPTEIKPCNVRYDQTASLFGVYEGGSLFQAFGGDPKTSADKAVNLYVSMIQNGLCKPMENTRVCTIAAKPTHSELEPLFMLQMDSKDIAGLATASAKNSAQYAIDLKKILEKGGQCVEPEIRGECIVAPQGDQTWLFLNSKPVVGYSETAAETAEQQATDVSNILFNGNVCTTAHSACYGVLDQGSWKPMCGEIAPPPVTYQTPSLDKMLSQNDETYLCRLMNLSGTQCADVQFTVGSAGISAEFGWVRFGFDVRMKYHDKPCMATVWKIHQADNTWVLASPTSIVSADCQIQ